MAKQVLLNFLIQHLGNFVDGLSKENLRLGIFSGNLELRNLTLKADVFDSLNLPIRLVYGVIKSINIKIPWTNLGKSPVVVNISNVLLHLEFCDENLRYSAHELEEITQKLKQSILEQAQRRAFSQACGNLKLSSAAYRLETTKHQSFSAFIQTYFQRVITKLLFNVELAVEIPSLPLGHLPLIW
jgi:RNase P/RNase MRP subunit POP5